ncbi:MAG: putative toxin-antitoxin system toxin component, PIN family [Polaromonas sp.]|uniref:putative toxin-antitoxin system toxin component, PIN family n=1 Tax=Polaromonas sp. TaxID=1869339 RepID=UPI0027330191|nr:putative toxin-antitoxin system toxin component, PIN family [Polaromonas sp.]MDP2819720.1 putative toxin-antitoxin system toxin component, PIN family [Polaromonas sp.]
MIDSNLIFSSVLKPSSVPGAVLGAWRAGHFDWVCCEIQLSELRAALTRPYLISRIAQGVEPVEKLLHEMRESCHWKALLAPLPAVCRDPRDDYLFALYDQGHADLIISGDKDVLACKKDYPVLTARELIDRL